MKSHFAHCLLLTALVLASCSRSLSTQASATIRPAAIQSRSAATPAPTTADAAAMVSADAAERLLTSTDVFCDNHTSYAHSPTAQVAAFNVLLDQPDAMARFDRLAAATNPVPRLYSLCAFQVADRRRFDRLLAELAPQNQIVDTWFGCIGGRPTIGELAAIIDTENMGVTFREARSQ